MVRGIHIPCRTAHGRVDLVVDGAGPPKERPVQRSRGQVKGTRVDEKEGSLARGDHGGLGKPDIVADGQPDLAVLGQVDDGQLVPGSEHFALLEPDLAWDVDVEEVRLAVRADQVPRWRKHQRRVVVPFALRFEFRDAPSHQVGLCIRRERRERMERRRLFLGWWRGHERLGVFGEVLRPVRRIEAFRENNQRCSCLGRFQHFAARVSQVNCLVRP